jgi:hypothetical protein
MAYRRFARGIWGEYRGLLVRSMLLRPCPDAHCTQPGRRACEYMLSWSDNNVPPANGSSRGLAAAVSRRGQTALCLTVSASTIPASLSIGEETESRGTPPYPLVGRAMQLSTEHTQWCSVPES